MIFGCFKVVKILLLSLILSINLFALYLSYGLASNAELIEFEKIQQKLDKWTIPKVDAKNIYQIGTFDFKSRTIIKTEESSLNIDNQDETCNLFHAVDLCMTYMSMSCIVLNI